MIWYILENGQNTGDINAQELVEYTRMIRFLSAGGKRPPTLNEFKLEVYLVELRVGDRVMALLAVSSTSAMQEARITQIDCDHTTGVRTYTLQFSNGHTQTGVRRRQIHTKDGRIPIAGTGPSATVLPHKVQSLDSHAVASYRAGGVSTVLLMCTYLNPDGDGIEVQMACGGVWDKEAAVVVAPQHLIPEKVTEYRIFAFCRDPTNETQLRACVATVLTQDHRLDLLMLQVPKGIGVGGALPLRETPVKAGENVWVMGWASIPGQSNGATLQRMPASVTSIDAETSELRLYMNAFKGLSGATVYDQKGYKVGQVQFKYNVPG